MSELTAKQRKFVREYLIDLNATNAARRAGYSKKTAYSQGGRLLKKAEIAAAINRCLTKVEKKLDLSAERILAEIASIGFAKISDYAEFGPDGVKLKSSSDVDTRAVSEVSQTQSEHGPKIKIKLWDKVSALRELAARVIGPVEASEPQAPALHVHFEIVSGEEKAEKVIQGEEIEHLSPIKVEFEIEEKG